jgi:uncharacterized NAD(P)/FAD-binding protein YdhS
VAPRQKAKSGKECVAIIGAGVSGTLFALKLATARPELRIYLIERATRAGRGLAYGACMDYHLLNVPIPRMEVGLTPSFTEWLGKRPLELSEAMAESNGDATASYVPRELFGQYLEERLHEALSADHMHGIVPIRGEAVKLLDSHTRGVLLHDGREIVADQIVLALGNLPPRAPHVSDDWIYDSPYFVPDPWTHDALKGINPKAPVLLLGTGLTMVDIALKLAADGHKGPMQAVSRRGLLPATHQAGGSWPSFLTPHVGVSPVRMMRTIRLEVAKAEAQGISWQRVIDAVRPFIARVWHSWSGAQRAQFLRHARARWDVHRHRMAPRIGASLKVLMDSGQLRIAAGRVHGYRRGSWGIEAIVTPRGGVRDDVFPAARVINCTGPRSDFDRLAIPLIADLKKRGCIVPDPLGQGIETDDCAAIDRAGQVSDWLFALGPLTRPAWWEITAVPEIALQVDRLAKSFPTAAAPRATAPLLADAFIDLGSGI